VRFFLDNNVSPCHAEALRIYAGDHGAEFEHLSEMFDRSTPDPEWIPALAADGHWIIISGDTRISTNPANRRAWIESKLTAFFFADPWQRSRAIKQAEEMLHWWPHIFDEAKRSPTGAGFLMPKNGNQLKQIYPERR